MIRPFFAAVALLVACSLMRADEPTTRPVTQISKPSLITLSVKDATVKSVLDTMQKQSKINPTLVSGQPELLETKISIDLKDVPWIEALMRVCEAASLNPYNYGDRWTISPRGGQRMLGPRHVEGPAMVALTGVVLDSSITYDTTARTTRQINITGTLAVEPNLEIDGVSAIQDVKIVDNLGRELKAELRNVTGQVASTGLISSGSLRRDFSLVADVPDGNAERLQSITGTLIAPALVERKTLNIPNLLTNQGKQFPFGDGQVSVEAIRERGNQISEVDLKFEAGSVPDGAMARLRSSASRIQPRQTNKADSATIRVSRLNTRDGATTLTLFVQFMQPPKPDTPRVVDLQWDLPVRYVDTSIPFRLVDVPLP